MCRPARMIFGRSSRSSIHRVSAGLPASRSSSAPASRSASACSLGVVRQAPRRARPTRRGSARRPDPASASRAWRASRRRTPARCGSPRRRSTDPRVLAVRQHHTRRRWNRPASSSAATCPGRTSCRGWRAAGSPSSPPAARPDPSAGRTRPPDRPAAPQDRPEATAARLAGLPETPRAFFLGFFGCCFRSAPAPAARHAGHLPAGHRRHHLAGLEETVDETR